MKADIFSEAVRLGFLSHDDMHTCVRCDIQKAAEWERLRNGDRYSDVADELLELSPLTSTLALRAFGMWLPFDYSYPCVISPFNKAIYTFDNVLCVVEELISQSVTNNQCRKHRIRAAFLHQLTGGHKGYALSAIPDFVYLSNKDGSYGDKNENLHNYANDANSYISIDKAIDLIDVVRCVWAANTLASCKNIRFVDEQRDGPPRVVLGSGPKRSIIPKITYKVLEIDQARTPGAKSGNKSATSGDPQQAFHLCRGHFANYDEKPLFGKYRGRFWIPQHARGAKKNGVVLKDYKVLAPDSEK